MSEMINPYIAGAPVTEKSMFFGRQDVFDWVQRSLTGKFVDHILVIHGQRRVGKTSVLKQIPFHLPPTYIPVFFDLQGRTHTSLDRFLWRLAKEIGRALRTTHNISLPVPDREDFARDPELFQNQLLPQLEQAIGDRRLLLIFDEFDSLEEPTAREMLAQDLIPYFSRMMHALGPLAFIFCIGSSGRKLEHMQASYTDFFRIALYRKISFLEKKEASPLITQPVARIIEYTPQAVEDIFHITSGHPYFTQLLCHELFGYCQKTGKKRITPKDIEAVLDDVVERGTVNLKFVWDDASDPERYVLAALSMADDGRDAKSIHQFLQGQKVRISQREVADSLRHLLEKDVLASDNSFTVDLMRLWLLQNKPIGRVIEELIEVSPIATRFIEIAQEFHETGMPDEALNNYRRALQVDPQNLAAQVGIASLIFEQGDLPQAAQEYQKALEIDPEDIGARSGFCQTHLALGDQLREGGQVEEALEHYRQILTVNEQHVEARERLAAHHAQQGARLTAAEEFRQAIEAFEKALEFTPEAPSITAQLDETRAAKRAKGLATLRETGEEHFRAERWEQAIASFEEYLSLEPEDAEAAQAVEVRLAQAREQGELAKAYRQGQAALNQKRYEEAVSLFKEIIDRDLSYKDAMKLLAHAAELQRRARPLWKDMRVLGGAGGAVVVIIAVVLFRFLPGFVPATTPAEGPTSSPEPTATLAPHEPTSTLTPPPSIVTPPPPTPATRSPTPTPTFGPVPAMRTLTGHPGAVFSIAFCSDGATLASGSDDVMLWDVQTGRRLRSVHLVGFDPGKLMVRSMAFSPDCQILASGSTDNRVRVWDAESGERLQTLVGHTDWVQSVAFSPEGAILASGSLDGTVILWDAESAQQLRTLEGHGTAVQSVAFSPDGAILASGSGDNTATLWDVESGQQLRTLEGHTDWVQSVAFSPDGQTLASGSSDDRVILWDVGSGEGLRFLEVYAAKVYSVAFSPDGAVLASGSGDNTAILWDVESGQQLRTLEGHSRAVHSVTFSPDGRTLASGSVDNSVILWDVQPAIARPEPTPPAPTPTLTPISPMRSLEGHTDEVHSVAFSPDGQTLASGSDDWMVILWDVESGQQLRTLEGYGGVHSMAFSPDRQTLASGWRDRKVRLWRLADGTLFHTLEGHTEEVQSVAFSPDGQSLASGSDDQTVILWDVGSGQQLRTLSHSDQVSSVAFSPDGATLVSASRDRTVRLWRFSDGELLHTLEGHTGGVLSVAFSPEGTMLASGSRDDTVILWDVPQ